MGASSDSTLFKSIKYSCLVTFLFIILGALGHFLFVPEDRNRCQSLLNQGRWQDDSFKQWQPSTCMMHTYKPTEISTCLSHARILYIGDSIARHQFLATVQLIKSDVGLEGEGHMDRKYQFPDQHLELEFWWDPYLNTSATLQLLENPVRPTSLLVVGTGAWQMHYLGETYFEDWKTSIDRVFEAVTRPIADAILVGPVEIPKYERLSKERTETMTIEKIERMNQYLEEKEGELKTETKKMIPVGIPFVWNQVSALSGTNLTEDGLHFQVPVTTMQSQIALNFRCNDGLEKKFPMDTTCCYSYPSPRWYQYLFLFFFLVWVPVSYFIPQQPRFKKWVPSEKILDGLFIFGICVVYMYLGDRTQLFGKIHKHFDAVVFTGLMIATAVLGMAKLEHQKEGDLGLLNRDQTNEWKGWMQLVILVYHFCGASGTSGIYNAVRVLVAAYLFQTGYGHFFYFYKKADFGIGRILNVMVRLNLLTFVLQYFMDTNYLSYYFTPLVSFWFLVIWVVMYVGHVWNKVVGFMLVKLIISCCLTTAFIHVPGVLEFIFEILESYFNVQWDAGEWRFRLALDAYIVYIGMGCAYAFIKISEHSLTDHPHWVKVKYTAFISSVLCLIWYFGFELSRDNKFSYNESHPFISWIPILSFIVLRNSTRYLRNTHSAFFSFIGKISLETFIAQFHMWLAGDTKGLLMIVLPHGLGYWWWWWINLAVSSCLFIFVCYYASQSTQTISSWICKKLLNTTTGRTAATATSGGGGNYQPLPLLPTNVKGQNPDQKVDAVATSSSSTSVVTKIEEEEEEIWDTSFASEEKPSKISLFFNDTRVKSILIILIVGLLNNLC